MSQPVQDGSILVVVGTRTRKANGYKYEYVLASEISRDTWKAMPEEMQRSWMDREGARLSIAMDDEERALAAEEKRRKEHIQSRLTDPFGPRAKLKAAMERLEGSMKMPESNAVKTKDSNE